MPRQFFGTDGVRGVANDRLTPELAFRLGVGAGRWLAGQELPPRAVLGRDTRRSGTMLGAALAAGLASAGIEVVTLGVAPTPAVSFVARTQEFGLGGIISASHNPAPDNGIKFVGHEGRKLPDAVEEEIEGLMDSFEDRPTAGGVGTITPGPEELQAYEDWLVSLVPERLDGMRVALDASHGAGFVLGPRVLQRLGADVVLSGVEPGDGTAINHGVGATHPDHIQALTKSAGAVVGVAFDGDADRAVFSDGEGRLINGDRTIALWADFEQSQNRLHPPVVVGTVMSNGGFEDYMRSRGIRLERTDVGDKYVAARLRELGARVGGEQSGHIIFPELTPTGDGLLTMLQVLRVLRVSGRSASEIYDDFANKPQLMINVQVGRKDGWQEAVVQDVEDAAAELGAAGRVNVRASGTSNVIRVMVEAPDVSQRDAIADRLAERVIAALGGHVRPKDRVELTYGLGD